MILEPDLKRAAEAFLDAYEAAPPTVRALLMQVLEASLGLEPVAVDAEGARHYLAAEVAGVLGMPLAQVLELGLRSPGIVLIA